jgi:hypothetical protein
MRLRTLKKEGKAKDDLSYGQKESEAREKEGAIRKMRLGGRTSVTG